MPTIKDDPKQLEAAILDGERRIAREFRAEIAAQRASLSDDDLDAIIATGALPADKTDNRKTIAAALAVFLLMGQKITTSIEEQSGARLAFDQAENRVLIALETTRDRLASIYASQQARAVQTAVANAIERGASQEATRIAVRQALGLTERQVGSIVSYRRSLEAVGQKAAQTFDTLFPQVAQMIGRKNVTADALGRALRDPGMDAAIKRAATAGKPLSADVVERAVQAYADRQLAFRARTIGESEAVRAVNEGAQEAWDQAADAGVVPASGSSSSGSRGIGDNSRAQVKETWRSQEDQKVRVSHRKFNGTQRPASGYWEAGNGPVRYPQDPDASSVEKSGCRCYLTRSVSV